MNVTMCYLTLTVTVMPLYSMCVVFHSFLILLFFNTGNCWYALEEGRQKKGCTGDFRDQLGFVYTFFNTISKSKN